MPSSKKAKSVRAATLSDVGREAGVSAMAASAVLNGARTSSRISPETRERIEEAALRLQYRPNAAARALANRRMDTIGVATVFESRELNPYFLEVFNGILETAALHEQNTTVFDWQRGAAKLPGWCDGRIDGLILIAPTLTSEAAKVLPGHTPFVAIHANVELPNVVNIETDEERGAYEVVRFLISQGHKRILHVSGVAGLVGSDRRLRGYKRALASAHIGLDNALIIPAGFCSDDGYRAMRSWLQQHAGELLPHAVFCVSDGVATGCLEALSEVGLRVPDDISVAGFDDTLSARTTLPQLTTVRQPLRAMGNRAVEVLLDRIHRQNTGDKQLTEKSIVFPVALVTRASVGAPPAIKRVVPSRR
ncbi:MAG: LacI family DNA-binding transcriptional regulator [Verrucomicrobia bacterium]|nr:LacI family DNA-binding transcriptional regulator [Verrucomicrobiota bacterium]